MLTPYLTSPTCMVWMNDLFKEKKNHSQVSIWPVSLSLSLTRKTRITIYFAWCHHLNLSRVRWTTTRTHLIPLFFYR